MLNLAVFRKKKEKTPFVDDMDGVLDMLLESPLRSEKVIALSSAPTQKKPQAKKQTAYKKHAFNSAPIKKSKVKAEVEPQVQQIQAETPAKPTSSIPLDKNTTSNCVVVKPNPSFHIGNIVFHNGLGRGTIKNIFQVKDCKAVFQVHFDSVGKRMVESTDLTKRPQPLITGLALRQS